jgi:hypothetical protein
MICQSIRNLLQEVERQVPPPGKAHHAIFAVKYGSAEQGWQDRTALVVNRGGKAYTFFLTDEDFEIPNSVARFIADSLEEQEFADKTAIERLQVEPTFGSYG